MKVKRVISRVLVFVLVCLVNSGTGVINGFAYDESKVITISFDKGEGEGIVPEVITAFEGEVVKLPVSTLTKDGYVFSWWSDGTDIYSQGGNYTAPASDVTLTAWFKSSRSKQVLHSLDTLNGVWGGTPMIVGEGTPAEGAGYVQTTAKAGEPVQICAMWTPLDISAYTGNGYLHFSVYIDDVTKLNQNPGHGFIDILPELNDYAHSWTINYDPAQLQNGWNEINVKLSDAYAKNTDLATARMFRYVQYITQNATIGLDDVYVWKASASYDVIFKGNGTTSGSSGEAAINKADLASGTQITLPGNIYFRDGYQFIGWSDGNAVYKPMDKYIVSDKSVRFDAQWKKINDFTGNIEISFNSNGAAGNVPATINASKGDVITLPDNSFTKDGYSFTWWTDGTEVYSQGCNYTVKDINVVFTPLWKTSGTRLMIDALDSTTGVWGVGQIQQGTAAPVEGSGYVQCTSLGTDPVIVCNMLPTKDISVFENNGYLHISVYVEDATKLNTNPGGGMIELWETTDGSKVCSFDLSKYTLKNGWNELDFKFGKDTTSNGANLSNIVMFRFFQHVLGATTVGLDNIYSWMPEDTYDIVFKGGGADSVIGDVNLINKSDLNSGTIIEMPNNIYKREGYRFIGWSDGDNVYRPREEYAIINKNVRFDAQWVKTDGSEEIEISFYKDKATGVDPEPIYASKGSTIILPMNPYTNGDLEFQWWSDGVSMYSQGGAYTVPESDVVLAPVWKSGGTKLVIDNMDSITGYWGVTTMNLGSSNQLEGSGYIWANAGPVGNDQAVIFCRVWPEPIDISSFYETGYFHVSVYIEDVTKLDNTQMNRALIELYDSPQTQTNIWDYSLAGKDLKNGWNEINFSIKNDAIRHGGDLSHITNFRYFHYVTQNTVIGIDDFYVWMPQNSHDLMFAGGGADAKYASNTLTPTTIKAIRTGSEYTLPFNMYKKEGYKFIGWTDGTNVYPEGSVYVMPNQSVRFDAKWEKLDDLTITYSSDGAEGSTPGDKAYEGKRIRIAENGFNRIGYSFVGWNDGSKTYRPGVIYTMPANDATFTAQWEEIAGYDLLDKKDTLEVWQLNDGGLADVLGSAINATKATGQWGWWLANKTFGTVLDMPTEGSYYVAKDSNVSLKNQWTMSAWVKLPPRPLNNEDRIIFSQSKPTPVEYTDYYTLESCDLTDGWEGFPGSEMTAVTTGQKEGAAYLQDCLTPVSVFKRVFNDPIDLSRYANNGYVDLWVYIDDASKIVEGSSRVEISHDLTNPIDYGDANYWTISGLTTGWNYFQLPIKDSKKFGNGADFSQIRYFRFFQYTKEKADIGIDDVTLCNLKEQPPKDEWKFYVSAGDGELNFSSTTLGNLDSSGVNIVDNKWHHVMVTMSGNKIYYWIDGKNVKTVKVEGNNLNVGTTDFYIGNNSNRTEGLDGSIAEARVFKKNKTPAQVTKTVLNPDDNIRKDTKLSLKKGVTMEIRSFFGQHYSTYEVYDPNKNVIPLNGANVDTALLLGFDHIKFCIAPNNLIDSNGSLIVENMTYITRNIDMTLAKGMPVLLCMHPEGDFKNIYLGNLKNFEKLVKWYSELAAYIGEHWSPDEVALQLMTEPFGNSSAVRWDWQSDRQVLAVRNVLPEHTILTSSTQAGNLEKLKEMSPATDDNLVYTFTTYEPYTIGFNTASPGMSGTTGPQSYLGDIPYPAPQGLTEAEIDALIETLIVKVPDSMKQQARDYLKPYLQGKYDTNPIFQNIYDVGYVREWNYKRMESLNKWSEANGGKIHIACVEFGMMDKTTATKYYGAAADTGISNETRYNFIHDLRDAFERYDIGWVYWHWNGTFTVFDPETRLFYKDVAPEDLEFCYDDQLIRYSLGLTPKWKEEPSVEYDE